MRYRIITYQNRLGQLLYIPEKKYPFFPFWMTFTVVVDSSGTCGTAQFDNFKEATAFIQKQSDGKWYRLNGDITVRPEKFHE